MQLGSGYGGQIIVARAERKRHLQKIVNLFQKVVFTNETLGMSKKTHKLIFHYCPEHQKRIAEKIQTRRQAR